jgi:peptidoglycan/xylan/chitin deacetylase (PgdA/CDA1 family)
VNRRHLIAGGLASILTICMKDIAYAEDPANRETITFSGYADTPATQGPASNACYSRHIPVLTYHNIGGSSTAYSNIATSDFIAQLDWLKGNGYMTIRSSDLYGAITGSICLSGDKYVALTFDDGYPSVYNIAYPELKGRGMNGFAFLIAGSNPFSRNQVRDMDHTVEIGSHLLTHKTANDPGLIYTSPATIGYEISESKKYLEDIVGHKIDSLCWPGGAFSDWSIDIARREGFRLMFTVWNTPNRKGTDPTRVGRNTVSRGESLQVYASKLRSDR